jgi:hypothetical protein
LFLSNQPVEGFRFGKENERLISEFTWLEAASTERAAAQPTNYAKKEKLRERSRSLCLEERAPEEQRKSA